MKHISIGILAHVDAGKTTLSESLLYEAKAIRTLGRVDHKDAFLDFDVQERSRGITIFSKQANFKWNDVSFTLLDTPGHVDFSLEMEKTLQVLDYAIVLINALDKVQSHTETIFRLLKHYQIPTYIFINKMDVTYFTKEEILKDIQSKLHGNCVDFSDVDKMEESIAMCDEVALDHYVKFQKIETEHIANAIHQRNVFPCIFGSALKQTNCNALLNIIEKYIVEKKYEDVFSAKVFKISRDEQNTRLLHLKIMGGKLRVKSNINDAKVDQIRIYSGVKYTSVDEVVAGQICCVKGLPHVLSGETIGEHASTFQPVLTSFMSYLVRIEDDSDPIVVYKYLKVLEDEEPQLQVKYTGNQEIHLQLMGEIQIEILQKTMNDRFSVHISFDEGSVVYKETINETVEGVGHYEPLGHYAEVHLLLSPLPRNSGIVYDNICDDELLNKKHQQTIMNHLQSKEHLGVLTRSPITDVKITLLGGKAHLKHSESTDFKEASHRAIRAALMEAKSMLLEPYYEYRIELSQAYVSTAIYDLEMMRATYKVEYKEEDACIRGRALVSKMNHYQSKLLSYTKGSGTLTLSMDTYDKSIDEKDILESIGYEPDADLANPSGSIFFRHGSGFYVAYDEVSTYMHIPYLHKNKPMQNKTSLTHNPTTISQEELQRVMNRNIPKTKVIPKQRVQKRVSETHIGNSTYKSKPICLLVDGYNMIFSWNQLKEISEYQLDAAREELIRLLSSFQGYKKCKLIVVFDAYKIDKHKETIINNGSIDIVYTRKAQSADQYIELSSKQFKNEYTLRVATSDNLEQIIVFGQGALRVSAQQFEKEVYQTLKMRDQQFKETQKKAWHQPLEEIKKYNK